MSGQWIQKNVQSACADTQSWWPGQSDSRLVCDAMRIGEAGVCSVWIEPGHHSVRFASMDDLADFLDDQAGINRLQSSVDGVSVGLPSSMCLCADYFHTNDARSSVAERLFSIEEQLPFDAESIAARFIRRKGGHLGVAVQRDALQTWFEPLQQRGWRFNLVAPTALIVLSDWIYSQFEARTKTAILSSADGFDLVRACRRKLAAWHWFAPQTSTQSLAVQLELCGWSDVDSWFETQDQVMAAQVSAGIDGIGSADRHPMRSLEVEFVQTVSEPARNNFDQPVNFCGCSPLPESATRRKLRGLACWMITLSLLIILTFTGVARHKRLSRKYQGELGKLSIVMQRESRSDESTWSTSTRLKQEVLDLREADRTRRESGHDQSAIHSLHDLLRAAYSIPGKEWQSIQLDPESVRLEGIANDSDHWQRLVKEMSALGFESANPMDSVNSEGRLYFEIEWIKDHGSRTDSGG